MLVSASEKVNLLVRSSVGRKTEIGCTVGAMADRKDHHLRGGGIVVAFMS